VKVTNVKDARLVMMILIVVMMMIVMVIVMMILVMHTSISAISFHLQL